MLQSLVTLAHTFTRNPVFNILGFMAINLLLLIVIFKEILRTSINQQHTGLMRKFNLIIIPLFLGFGVIMILRLISVITPAPPV